MVEQLAHDADHIPSSGTEVKNEWSCTSIFTLAFVSCKGQLSFTFIQGFANPRCQVTWLTVYGSALCLLVLFTEFALCYSCRNQNFKGAPRFLQNFYTRAFVVHGAKFLYLMWNKKPTRCHLVLYLFLLYKLLFISCSTCFGPPCAHFQELTT